MLNINTILIKICDKLSLSQTLYQKLKEHYRSVSEYLTNCEGLDDLEIYPQGSVAIGTTIKPIGREEYDLDFVCEKNINPFSLFQIITKNLKKNGKYKNIVEEKKRCVRINYKGDFHLDILPARPDPNSLSQTGILIPDRELKNLLPSDPKEYVSWFNNRSDFRSKADKIIEPLPQYQPASQKNYLQCIVQLMKRHRDIFFKHKLEDSPPSIIITTLCGNYYINKGNILDNITSIVDAIKTNSTSRVCNPVNPKELLSEKWEENPILYNSFTRWIGFLHADLQMLKIAKNKEEKLKEMFGENIMKPILDELEERSFIHKNRSNLSISSSGILSTSQAGIPIPKNTFQGEEND